MKIGIISDSHDDIQSVRDAIEIFNANDVSFVIHAGDYIFPGIVYEFKKLHSKLVGVLGNNDGELFGLYSRFKEIGGELKGNFFEISIDKIRIGVYHGTVMELREATIKSGMYDVFIHGHTHQKRNDIIGATLVLNPGTVNRYLSRLDNKTQCPSVIIFDSQTRTPVFIDL